MAFSEQLEFAYFEGDIVPFADANISIGTHVVQYGTGAFAGIRGYLSADGKAINIVRLQDHCTRLLRSAKLLRMDLALDRDSMAQAIIDLTRKNAPNTDVYYRPFVYKASVELTPRLLNLKDEFACYMLPMGDYLDTSRGMNMIVTSWTRTEDNMIPSRGKITGSYINASFAKDQAMAYGCDDAIMLNSRGKVAEGSAANLFMVRDGVLVTAPINGDILEGITRRSVMTLAEKHGWTVEQRDIDRSELYLADEVFFCGTGVQVAWVQTIDGRTIGSGERGPVAKQLYDDLFAIFRGESADHGEWVTRVEV